MAHSGDESILKSAVMGREWAKQIGEQLEDLTPHQLVPTIFQVPEFLKFWDAKSYTPQLVGLGPFHHFKPQLQETTAVIKRRLVEQGLRAFCYPAGGNIDDDLRNFTDQVVTPLLPAIRAQYNSHLDILDSTLASLVALDSLFLVGLMVQGSSDHDEEDCNCGSILMNDAVMLENQIPLFLLPDHSVSAACSRAYQHRSPLQFIHSFPITQQPRHVLEHLYFQIVGGGVQDQEEDSSTSTDAGCCSNSTSFLHILEMAPLGLINESQSCTSYIFDIFDLIYDAFQAVLDSKFLRPTGLFWVVRKFVSLMDGLRCLLLHDHACVPSASLLTRHLGLRILPAGNSILKAAVRFNDQEKTLRLPVLTLKPSCGTLIRNLMAYEYITRSDDARFLAGYLKLISELTRTVEDMKLLRGAGVIVVGDAQDDESALKLFFSEMPPVYLSSEILRNSTLNETQARIMGAEDLEAALEKRKAAHSESVGKLYAMDAAKDRATALDSLIQALAHSYNQLPIVTDLNRRRHWTSLGFKIAALVIVIYAAVPTTKAAVETVSEFVSLDFLYHWPCCPQGLWSAVFSLVVGGYLLNILRAIL